MDRQQENSEPFSPDVIHKSMSESDNINEKDKLDGYRSMSNSCYSTPGDRTSAYPLHNDTWANTVPVTKKDKSEKIQNWRAAGRAIRRMLTKGILPSRSHGMGIDKNLSRDNLDTAHLNESHLSNAHNVPPNSGDGMNEMYAEFENSKLNLGDRLSKENQCKHNNCDDIVHENSDVKSNNSETFEMNGTLSSVLKSLGMSSESLRPPNPNSLNWDNEHSVQDVQSDLVKESNQSSDNHVSKKKVQKKSPHKDSLNWHDLKQRITRLTQRSKKKLDLEQPDGSVERFKPLTFENSAKGCKSQEFVVTSQSHTQSEEGRDRVIPAKCMTEERTRKELKEVCGEIENSGVMNSKQNKIKSKHKQSPISSHNLGQFVSQQTDWYIEGMSKSDPPSNAMVLPEIPQNTCSSANLSSDSASHSNFHSSKIGLPHEGTVNSIAESSSQQLSDNSEVFPSNQNTVIPMAPYLVTHQPALCRAVAETRHLWDDRPIFPTANILFDSSVQDEGFEAITHPLPPEELGINLGNVEIPIAAPQTHCKHETKKKMHHKHKSDASRTKRDNTKPQRDYQKSKPVSTSDSSISGDNSHGEETFHRCKPHNRKKAKRRRELVSIYSAGGGDMALHGSQENLAELCPHQDEDIRSCMRQFLNEDRSGGSSGDGGESSLEEKACLAGDVDSVDSIPRLLSSSSELELAAEIMNDKFKVTSAGQERHVYSSVPDLVETDESDFFDDILPDLDLAGSDEEKDEPVELSPRELASLPELRSSSSSTGSQADDEFECECGVCQNSQDLFAPHPNSWITEDEEEFFGPEEPPEFSIRYQTDALESERDPMRDPFDLDLSELNPMDLLLMRQGRRDLLEVMFQNVILQMLAVYPELLNEQAPPPLEPVDLDKIPIVTIDTEHIAKDATCPICLCEFEEGEDGRQLACLHLFHKLCIEAWLVKSGTCPVCRLVLSKKPAEQ